MPPKLSLFSGMPKIASAFRGWESDIRLVTVAQIVESTGLIRDTERYLRSKGVVQPLSPQQLMLKPEGERSWEWLQIHCRKGSVKLKPNDRIICNNRRYKVMERKDYSLDDYVLYHVIYDTQDGEQ